MSCRRDRRPTTDNWKRERLSLGETTYGLRSRHDHLDLLWSAYASISLRTDNFSVMIGSYLWPTRVRSSPRKDSDRYAPSLSFQQGRNPRKPGYPRKPGWASGRQSTMGSGLHPIPMLYLENLTMGPAELPY